MARGENTGTLTKVEASLKKREAQKKKVKMLTGSS